MRTQITVKIVRQKIDDIQFNNWMLNLIATHFFCADEIQFESLNVETVREEIRMMNSDVVKSDRWDTVRLVVNDKNLDRQISHELLLHKIIYTSVLEINLLSTFILIKISFHVIVDWAENEIQTSENHDLIIINLILINNLYFLDVMKNSFMQINTIIKKSN